MTKTIPLASLSLGSDDTFTNPRRMTGLDEASLRDLADSIVEHGLVEPLIVWFGEPLTHDIHQAQNPEPPIVLDGQRRVLAMRNYIEPEILAEKFPDGIPYNEIHAGNMHDAMVLAIQTTVQRMGLSSYELAEAAVKLEEAELAATGKTYGAQGKIAQTLNKDQPWVSKMLNTWKNASDALFDAWSGDLLTDKMIWEIGALPKEAQPDAIAEAMDAKKKGPGKKSKKVRSEKEIRDKIAELKPVDEDEEQKPVDRWVTSALQWVLCEDSASVLENLKSRAK